MALISRRFVRSAFLTNIQTQFIRPVSNKVHLRQIDSNLQLLHKDSPEIRRPLVLLYAWLAAKGRHKKKYADFYLNKGFDVLHVSIKPTQLLFPLKAQSISLKLLDLLLEDPTLRDREMALHAFSVGGYLYGEALVKMTSDPVKYGDLASRIRGHVYDSPVGRRGIPEGFPKALTKNKLLINSSRFFLDWYLETFKESATNHYDRAENTALRNDLAIPALFLYSKADPVGQAEMIESFIERMKSRENAEIFSHCWDDSKHVSHMLHHPQEYLTILNQFLQRIGLVPISGSDKIEMKL